MGNFIAVFWDEIFVGVLGLSKKRAVPPALVGPQQGYPNMPPARNSKHESQRALPTPGADYRLFIAPNQRIVNNGLYKHNVKRWQTFTGTEGQTKSSQTINPDYIFKRKPGTALNPADHYILPRAYVKQGEDD